MGNCCRSLQLIMDVLGQALEDYFYQRPLAKLLLHNNYGKPEKMPVEVFFRNEGEMPELETIALRQCRGKILDIGAGVGSHVLVLQEEKADVTALEVSDAATRIMKERGVKKVIQQDIMQYKAAKYDTLLLLMNGIGLVGRLGSLGEFLQYAKTLLAPDGQLIFDSSDIAYLYDDKTSLLSKKALVSKEKYYGEISFQYEYRGIKGEWFNWLYVDQKTLNGVADAAGWMVEVVYEDDYDQYLARLVFK